MNSTNGDDLEARCTSTDQLFFAQHRGGSDSYGN